LGAIGNIWAKAQTYLRSKNNSVSKHLSLGRTLPSPGGVFCGGYFDLKVSLLKELAMVGIPGIG
jgi:hypothetical protein